jgi:hypothetical protein
MEKFSASRDAVRDAELESSADILTRNSGRQKMTSRQRMLLAVFLFLDVVLVCAGILIVTGKLSLRF